MRELRETPAETGTVLRVAPGRAWVRLARNEACTACKGCAIGAGGKYMIAEAQDPLGVSVEDEIRIRPAKAVGSQKAALLLFGVPIPLLFAGYAAGQAAARAWGLDPSMEAPGAVGGLLAMALGFVALYLISRRRRGAIGVFIVSEIVHKRARPRDGNLSCRPQEGEVGSMLVERRNVRQVAGEGFRRWFSDEYFDLIVWYEGEAQADSTADVVAGFQLCYDKRGQERALSWRREGGFSHDLIDAGEIPGQPNMSPVLQPGGELSEAIVKRFRSNSPKVGLSIQNLVCTKLSEYRKACRRNGAGRAVGFARS